MGRSASRHTLSLEPGDAPGRRESALSVARTRARLIKISPTGVVLMARPTAMLSPPGKKIYGPNLHFTVHD